MAFNGEGPHTKRQRTDNDSANNRGFNTSIDEPRRKRPDDSKPNHILLFTIINPMYPITVDVLHTICQPSGQVLRIVIFKKNGVQAMVEFDSVESAVRAKESLSGADIYSGCCTLKIDFAKPEKLNVHKNDSESWDYTVPLRAENQTTTACCHKRLFSATSGDHFDYTCSYGHMACRHGETENGCVATEWPVCFQP